MVRILWTINALVLFGLALAYWLRPPEEMPLYAPMTFYVAVILTAMWGFDLASEEDRADG